MTPSPWSVSFEPLYLALAVFALVLYVRAWRQSPGRPWRAVSFGAGLLLVVAALNSPLGTIATEYLVLFHLLQNVTGALDGMLRGRSLSVKEPSPAAQQGNALPPSIRRLSDGPLAAGLHQCQPPVQGDRGQGI